MEVSNQTEVFRNKISNYFSILFTIEDDDLYYEKCIELISNLKNNNKLYENVMTIAFLDHYKMNYHYLINLIDEEETKALLDYYEENVKDKDDLIMLLEEDEEMAVDMIRDALLFDTLSKNTKRELLVECKLRDKYLKDFSLLHVLDKMYYAKRIDLNDFIEKYNEYKRNGIDAKAEAIIEFREIIKDIFISDVNTYASIIDSLIDNYKIYIVDKTSFSSIEKEILNILSKDIMNIYHSIYSSDTYIEELLKKYLVFKIEYSKERQNKLINKYKNN